MTADRRALGDVIELAYGGALPARSRRPGDIPVYGSNGVAGWHDEPLVNEPTVIVGRKGSAGAVQFVDGPSFPIDTTYFVRLRDPANTDLRYVYHALEQLDLSRLATATGVPGLNREDAYRQQLPLPPLEEQRRIVDLLSRAAGIRRLAEAAQTKARDLIPALFVSMFGDPATNPKRWPVVTLGETGVRFVGGQNLQAGDEDASQYRILKISAVTSGTFRPDEAKPAPVGHTPRPEHFVKSGDVLFSRANTVDLVGATALVSDAPDNLLLPDKLWRIDLPAAAPVRLGFLLHFLRQPHTRQEMSRMASGTSDSMRNISQGRLKVLPLMTPPRALQDQFEGIVAEASAQTVLAERASATANALAQSIMAKVFAA